MSAYVDCPICSSIPNEDRGFYSGSDWRGRYPDAAAICRIPGERGLISASGGTTLWVCPSCGTYFWADSLERGYPDGSIQTRLFRITICQALYYFIRWYRTPPAGRVVLESRFNVVMQEVREWLQHSRPEMRAFAARTLADFHKVANDWKSLAELLCHPDAAVRRGAVSAFRRGPWFMIVQDPRPVRKELVRCLADPDEDVRQETSSVLGYAMDGTCWGTPLLPRLRRIAPSKRTPEMWEVLLREPERIEDLALGLAAAAPEVRHTALMRAFEWSQGHPQEIQKLRALLEATPGSERTAEMHAYITDPDPAGHWSGDDD